MNNKSILTNIIWLGVFIAYFVFVAYLFLNHYEAIEDVIDRLGNFFALVVVGVPVCLIVNRIEDHLYKPVAYLVFVLFLPASMSCGLVIGLLELYTKEKHSKDVADAYREGFEKGSAKSYEEGFNVGWHRGHEKGVSESKNKPSPEFEKLLRSETDKSYQAGYNAGYSLAHQQYLDNPPKQ